MAASPIAPPPVRPFDKTLALGETAPKTPAVPPPKKTIGPGTAVINETPSGTAKVPNTLSGYAQMLSEKIITEHPTAWGQVDAFVEVYKDPFKNKYSLRQRMLL